MREDSLKEMMKVTDQCFTSWVLLSKQVLFHVQLVPMIPKPTRDRKIMLRTKEALLQGV